MWVRRLWLCLPAIVLCATDGCLTLWGQPAAYWSGGFAVVREGNPLAAWLLTLHPLAFGAAGVPYLLLVVCTVRWLPRRGAAVVAVGVAAAHAFAVVVWCLVLFHPPWFALGTVALVAAGLGVLAWQRGWRGGAEHGLVCLLLPGQTPTGTGQNPPNRSLTMRIQLACKRCDEPIDVEVEPGNVYERFAGGKMETVGEFSVKCPGCAHVYMVTRPIPDEDRQGGRN
jgi:hypothetical protein